MKSFGPQRIVVAILILVIAGYAGGLLMGGDSDDGAVSPLDSSDGGDQLVGVTTPPAEFSMWQVLTTGETDRFAAVAEAAGARRDLESLVDADRVTLQLSLIHI